MESKNEIYNCYNTIIEQIEDLAKNEKDIKDKIHAIKFYIANLVTCIEWNRINLNLLIEIEKVFKNDKELVVKFIRYFKDKYDKKDYKCIKVINQAINEFKDDLKRLKKE